MTSDVLVGLAVSLGIVAAAGLLLVLFGALACPFARLLLGPPRSTRAASSAIPRATLHPRRSSAP